MKINTIFLSLATGVLFNPNISTAVEQKILFNVESVRYKADSAPYCQGICLEEYTDPPIEKMLKQGWRIISSSPKEALGSPYEYTGTRAYGCTCVGTQYILQKDNPTSISKTDSPSKNKEMLNKENELLKRENDLLKQENEKLKMQLNSKQKNK